ncbi:MAG: 5-(carboxyamino)imidazole ribonucleotide synthase [Thaumarchaeota archaeon]|nr:5-(carboxyamino)imidazole ribonucleotide synthase [Nitrososphaerota archaeon]
MKARIGFVGGGQLALMTAQEAERMRRDSGGDLDITINILDPEKNCPAHALASEHVVAGFSDPNGLQKLASVSDIISYEIELGDAGAIALLRDRGVVVRPSPETLGRIQDKFVQKRFLASRGIPVPRCVAVAAIVELGLPSMLKARRGGYDGRGNYLLRVKDDVEKGYARLGGKELVLEEFIPWTEEVSVIAARDERGKVSAFPVGENIHEEGILRLTAIPARTTPEVAASAERVAGQVLEAFGDIGVFGVEMFVRDGEVLVNEVAPRVHNTGHGTLERDAFPTSQFEQHMRAVTGMPFGETTQRLPVVMHNILGEDNGYQGRYRYEGLAQAEALGARMHLYGKAEVRPRRKMGHLSLVGERLNAKGEVDRLVERAERARSMVRIVGVE